jgi:hypothetical protein
MMKMKAEVAEQIVGQINNIVEGTGYPVAGFILEKAGIATRAQLRVLKRKGRINEVSLSLGNSPSSYSQGTMVKGYYGHTYPQNLLVDKQEVTSEEQSN